MTAMKDLISIKGLLGLVFMLLSIPNCNGTNAQQMDKLMNLKGRWKFSIGDDKAWAKPEFNDSDWEWLKVPSTWEDEGYHGYDGYAWYRKKINISSEYRNTNLILGIGKIDDVDEVYFNGTLIGFSGTFPPNYETAYGDWRNYAIPENLINYDKDNVIAVRVYDSQMGGGIVEGNCGIYESSPSLRLDLNLAGIWDFRIGDDLKWKESKVDLKEWSSVYAPAKWESQGFADYDGFAWYRKSFKISGSLKNKKLVLLLGKIDDIDEVYINGKLVGATGKMTGKPIRYDRNSEWNQSRTYYINSEDLKFGEENVISVRVYDGYNIGGIYEGPLGFVEQSKFTRYMKEKRSLERKNMNRSFWDLFN